MTGCTTVQLDECLSFKRPFYKCLLYTCLCTTVRCTNDRFTSSLRPFCAWGQDTSTSAWWLQVSWHQNDNNPSAAIQPWIWIILHSIYIYTALNYLNMLCSRVVVRLITHISVLTVHFSQQWHHIHGLVQDCGISCALAMGMLQSYAKPSIPAVALILTTMVHAATINKPRN